MLELIRDEIIDKHNDLIKRSEKKVAELKENIVAKSSNFPLVAEAVDQIRKIEDCARHLEGCLPIRNEKALDFTTHLRWWIEYADEIEKLLM